MLTYASEGCYAYKNYYWLIGEALIGFAETYASSAEGYTLLID